MNTILANIYLFKFNNRNTRKRYEKCWNLTIKTTELRQWCNSDVLLTLNGVYTFFLRFYCWLWISKCQLGWIWHGTKHQITSDRDHVTSNFLKVAFHKFYFVHSWILCPMFPMTNLNTLEEHTWTHLNNPLHVLKVGRKRKEIEVSICLPW